MGCVSFSEARGGREGGLSGVLVAAMRSWRGSRDAGAHTLPRLYRALRPRGAEMMGLCFDSMFLLSEQTLGRALVAGVDETLSADEMMLVSMMNETGSQTPQGAHAQLAEVLESALRSARVLWSFAGAERCSSIGM